MVRTIRCRCLLTAVMVFVLPATCHSQAFFRIQKDQPPLPIDETTANSVIERVSKRLNEEYVFPELAAKMVADLRKRQAEKEYAGIKTGQALAERLTKDLQAVSKDKHLRIICSTAKLPKPPAGMDKPGTHELPAEMKARMRQMGHWINGGYSKVERLAGNVGYLEVDGFPEAEDAVEPAAAAMNFLANTDALIIDLRHNGGGSPDGVALLCSYFFDSKPVHLNDLYFREGNRTTEYWTRKEVAGNRYLGKDVYLLTSSRTFSGAEEFAYDLQTQKRATIVGETTGGGAHPGGSSPIDDHFVMFVPGGRAINPITKTDWEGTGVRPDVPTSADAALEKAHDLAIQKLLKNAKDDESGRMIQMDIERSHDRQVPKPKMRTP